VSVTSPSTAARAALKALIEAEFAVEGFTVADDHLHESIGWEGTRLATSPLRERPLAKDNAVLICEIKFQFYGKWKKEIDPETKVNPAKIENYAERFRRAIEAGDPHTSSVWYFNLLEIAYVHDPTGNKTRFEARVDAVTSNSAIWETSG